MTNPLGPNDDEAPFRAPRAGACCAYHPDREALVGCLLCDRDVCFSCFFPDVGRCQRCIEDHPDEVSGPVPFEAPTLGFVRGFLMTLVDAWRPRATAASFAIGGSLARPAVFAALTFVPLALLRGVIPYTALVHFGSLGAVRITAGATSSALAIDLLRACSLSLLESTAQLIALAACYASLAGAFGREGARRIATRAILYRAYLLPSVGLVGLLPMSVAWLGPPVVARPDLLFAIGMLPALPLFIGLQRTVRTVGRVDAVPGFALAVVPWTLFLVVGMIATNLLAPFMPSPPT